MKLRIRFDPIRICCCCYCYSAGNPGLKWSCMCDCSKCTKPPSLHWLRAKCAIIEPLEIVKSLAAQVIVFDCNNYLVLVLLPHILIRPLSFIDKELQLNPNPVIPRITAAGQDTSTVACSVRIALS